MAYPLKGGKSREAIGRRIIATLLVAALLAGQALTLTAKAEVYPSQVTGNVIRIGMSISLTGFFKPEGVQKLCGAKAVIKWYNDQGGVDIGGKRYMLQLVYYDDFSSKDLVPSLYVKLIDEDKVDFLLAPYSSTLTLSAMPVAEEKRKVILSHGGASDTIVESGYKYIVQVLTPASRYLEPAVKLVAEKIPDAKIALIFKNDPYAQQVKRGTKNLIQQFNLKVVYEADYPPETKDFSTFIQEAMSKGADVLLGGGHYEDGKALTAQAHSLGWKLRFIALVVAPTMDDFMRELGPSVANGVAGATLWEPSAPYNPQKAKELGLPWAGPTIEEFMRLFKEVCPDQEISYHAAEMPAAVVFLVEAIKKAYEKYGESAIRDSDKVREAFNDLKIMTLYGPLWIDPATGRQLGHPPLLSQWQEGKRYLVYPPEVAERPPLIAPPNWWPTQTTTTTQPAATQTVATTQTQPPTAQTTPTPAGAAGTPTSTIVAALIIIAVIVVAAVILLRR